ncbi:hypothetical protein GCM10010954_10340 [Halobacillus andaensis]|uniref:YcxB-like C-terminal domain-containing protein n=1 Tax=Halobacillus andaensis TaxID=1176239 RepID=A0A917B2F5_HALAA|nr:YcxB family protein [Halobacillus andaensis]MBP2003826.1 hypothetical protein [Halobacillus andaensis]GGF13539.1 hypothetical protein GCM10010954_10340 [Halobacillus andaensis]
MKENQRLTVSGALTVGDYRRHNNYHMKKVKLIYFLAAFALFFYVSFRSMEGPWLISLLVTSVVSFLLAGFVLLFLILMINVRATREFNKDRRLQSEITYIFRSMDIKQKFEKSVNQYQWSDLLSVQEQKDLFQLYVSKHHALILSKWFFDTEEEIDTFKAMIKKYADTNQIKFL